MKTFVLIGGKDPSFSSNFDFEKCILSHLRCNNPTILYVQLAQTTLLKKRFEQFKQGFTNFSCSIESLCTIHDLDLKSKLEWADVIYVAGGRASKLIHEIKGTYIEDFIRADKKRIWMGISAGAILFSKAGMGDEFVYTYKSEQYGFQMVEGLGLLPITCCPHYNHNGLSCYNDIVSSFAYDGYALEDHTALIATDTYYVLKDQKNRSVYRFSKEKNYQMIPIYEEV